MGSHISIKKRKPTLPPEDMKYLVEKTVFTEEQIRGWYKVYLRECPDGQLTRDKFVDIYTDLFPQGKAKNFYEHIFRTFDADNSGKINFKEFLMAISVTKAGTPEQKLELAFRLYDIDGNGVIEEDEMSEVLKAIYLMAGRDLNVEEETPLEKTKAIFKNMDENGDGVLTLEEFVKGCLSDSILYQILIES